MHAYDVLCSVIERNIKHHLVFATQQLHTLQLSRTLNAGTTHVTGVVSMRRRLYLIS
jgi:hypothetical protein